MRWKSLSDRTTLIVLSPVLIPMVAMSAAPILLIVGVLWLWGRIFPPYEWRAWFAWRPVFIDGFWFGIESRWVWLETIERERNDLRVTPRNRYRTPEMRSLYKEAA